MTRWEHEFRLMAARLPLSGLIALADALRSGSREVVRGSTVVTGHGRGDGNRSTVIGCCPVAYTLWKCEPAERCDLAARFDGFESLSIESQVMAGFQEAKRPLGSSWSAFRSDSDNPGFIAWWDRNSIESTRPHLIPVVESVIEERRVA